MMRRLLAVILLLWATPAFAQEELTVSKIYLGSTPCAFSQGTAAPSGGSNCDIYVRLDTATATIYQKTGGTWVALAAGITPSALTKADDTNVTLTLGGTPATALLQAASITAGWTGQLSLTRGGTNASLTASHGAVPYSTASAFGLTGVGSAGQLFQSAGAASPTWTSDLFTSTTIGSAYIYRVGGTDVAVSDGGTGKSSWTANGVLFAASTGTLDQDTDLTFSTDTLTATKAVTPTSLTTPKVYGYGAPNSVAIGGSGLGGCTTDPPTSANCEPLSTVMTSAFFEQALPGQPQYRTAWYVGPDGGHLRANNTTGTGSWMPLMVQAAPLQLTGGGLRLGGYGVTDPGLGNAYIDGWLRSTNPAYASQTTGMALDFTSGSIDAQYLFVQEMHAKKFIADIEIALLGGVTVTKSQATVAVAFRVPVKGSLALLTVKDIPDTPGMDVFEAGDVVLFRTFDRSNGGLSITNAWGLISAANHSHGTGTQTWTWTRVTGTAGGTMADTEATRVTIPVDALALDFGVSGSGYYEINAADGAKAVNSPYSQVVTWTGDSPQGSNATVRVREGNLKGIGPGTWGYGLFAGNYAAGTYAVFSDQTVELHNIPLSLYNGASQTMYMNPTLSSFGQSTSGASALTYTSGVGCWSGIDVGTFKWRCGDPAGQYIQWTGSSLIVNGNITVTGLVASDTLAVNGVAAATVSSGAARGILGLTAAGNPALPAASTPSGSGLFLGSDYMGYYASSAWKTFMRSNGDFGLTGTGGAGGGSLVWTSSTSTLEITGKINIVPGGNAAAVSDIPTTLAALDSTANTKLAGIEAGATVTATHTAADTTLVNGVAAATVQGYAGRAGAGFDVNGDVQRAISAARITGGTPSPNALNLTGSYLGWCTGTCAAPSDWKTYLDNNGNLYLTGTGGGGGGSLSWVSSTSTLTITGVINVVAGSSVPNSVVTGLGPLATSSASESSVLNSNISIGANGALSGGGGGQVTVAGIGADVAGAAATAKSEAQSYADGLIPATIKAPSGTGLFLGTTYMGYYTGGAFQTFIKSDGTWYFAGDANNYVSWNGSTLTVKGAITVTGGDAATQTYASGVAATAQANAISTASGDATTKANAAAAASLDRATFLDSIPGTIKGTLITSSSITTSQIAANTIVAGNIAANTITASQIAANTITASQIAAGTITGSEISATLNLTVGSSNNVVKLSGDDATYRIWAGHATAASAPFSVTKAGVLNATGAVLSGSLAVTGGVQMTVDTAFPPSDNNKRIRILNGTDVFGYLGATYNTYRGVSLNTVIGGNTYGVFIGNDDFGGGDPYIKLTADATRVTGTLGVTGAATFTSTVAASGFKIGTTSGASCNVSGVYPNGTFSGGILTSCGTPDSEPVSLLSRIQSLESQVAALTALLSGSKQ